MLILQEVLLILLQILEKQNNILKKLSNINSLQHCKALVEVFVYGTKVTNVSKLADAGILVHYTPKV